jgi:hypothetical protein
MKSGRFLFVLWDGGGNVNPFLALGARLRERGHHVRVFGPTAVVARFAAVGVDTTTWPDAAAWSPTADEVLAELSREPIDVAVVDYMLPAALAAADASDTCTVALVHTLYRAMQLDGEMMTMLMATDAAGVNALCESLGVAPVRKVADLLDRVARVVVLSHEALDLPCDAVGANVVYAGPILEDAGGDAGWTPLFPPDDRRPLVVVGLGTTAMDEAPVVQRLLHALADLDVRVLVTVGPHLDPTSFDVPTNARVGGYVRHAAVLPHASVLVNHAGHGSIAAGLHHGLPMLCIPLGRDQPANAAAIARVGAGLVLTSDASGDELRDAVAELLASPDYRVAAAGFVTGEQAVDEVERALER